MKGVYGQKKRASRNHILHKENHMYPNIQHSLSKALCHKIFYFWLNFFPQALNDTISAFIVRYIIHLRNSRMW
jgi:hypothetical protein